MTKDQALKIDEILTLLIKHNSPQGILAKDIAIKLSIDLEEIQYLCNRMIYDIRFAGDTIIKTDYFQKGFKAAGRVPPTLAEQDFKNLLLFATYNTDRFIEWGGTIKWFRQYKQDLNEKQYKKKLEQKKLENELASFKLTKKQFYWTIGIAIAGFLFSSFAVLNQIFDWF